MANINGKWRHKKILDIYSEHIKKQSNYLEPATERNTII